MKIQNTKSKIPNSKFKKPRFKIANQK